MGGKIVDYKKDKKRKTIVKRKRKKERKKNRVIAMEMMIFGLLEAILFLFLKEVGFRAAKLNPSSFKKQRSFSQRLPCFFVSKEAGKVP
jgi:accessory gene regulator protein AgrB